jgi:prevent-host-death family protein
MAIEVPIRQLRNETARVIELVESGTDVVLTSNGVPIAEIRPISAARSNRGARFLERVAAVRGVPYDSGLTAQLADDKAAAIAAQGVDRWA